MTHLPRRRRSLARTALLALLAAGIACDASISAPVFPRNAVRMDALPQYELWWRLTERCSGRTGDFSAIHWYQAPGSRALGSPDIQGVFLPRARNILLAGNSIADGPLVRHEMLHALVRDGVHPAEYFQDRCGGTVVCLGECIEDGGPQPAVDSLGPIVSPSEISVTSRVDSTAPSLSRDDGWVVITIEVHNPRASAVRVRLPAWEASGWYESFSFVLSICGLPGWYATDLEPVRDSLLVLGPGQTRRETFDVQAYARCSEVSTAFGGDTLPVIKVVPVP